jgi:hypothetical protein
VFLSNNKPLQRILSNFTHPVLAKLDKLSDKANAREINKMNLMHQEAQRRCPEKQ